VHLIFRDALKVDYSMLEYDVVLTSLPYFNRERYANQVERTDAVWIQEFYHPLIISVWNSLKEGGHMLLNVDRKTYEEAIVP